ncbi:MAG: hypothetical protein A2W11_10620 [Ignavibacteria bacterium RBG_16_35_7]|nr:MAG: hypothetical protein A2W11_10620 [Ignavibacteria bacterium RBG_16_35_7]
MKTMTYLSFLLAVFFLVTGSSFAQDSTKTKMEHKHKMEMGKDMHHEMKMEGEMKSHKGMKMDSSKSKEQSIVRKGKIDLQAIDKNKDGKVYQDTMDWNVISDEPGKCPICEMTLKEVTINEAKYNLYKNGFEVKDY